MMTLSRRAFGAAAASVVAALGVAADCEHDDVCCGALGYSEHRLYACRKCHVERIWVSNVWVGDKTREGWWTVADYRAHFDNAPTKKQIARAVEVHLG